MGRWTTPGTAYSAGATSVDPVFNVALADETSYHDLDLSVRLRAVAGALNRGGSLV